MGVPGLWDVSACRALGQIGLSNFVQLVKPAGKSRSVAHLAVVEGFEKNTSGKRAYRIGIDASICTYATTNALVL